MNAGTSEAEKLYIIQGCREGIRADGRGHLEYRNIIVENQIFPHVNGSSRVRISDTTDIVCSVKLEITEPSLQTPDEGILEVSVDISPSCNLKSDDRRLMDDGSKIAQTIQSFLVDSSSIDLKSMCIISGKYVWSIQIDVLIFQVDGDPVDPCSMAVYIALGCTKVPSLEVMIGESGGPEDFELSGDLTDASPLDMTNVPVTVTILKVGDVFILDPNKSETDCASGGLVIAVDRQGGCCGVSKLHGGSLKTSDISFALEQAATFGRDIISRIDSWFSSEVFAQDTMYPDRVPIREGLMG